MRVHTGSPVHNQHAQVRRHQRPRRLGGEIDVAGRVNKGKAAFLPFQPCLPGKDGDTAFTLDGVDIQYGIAMVHAARAAKRPRRQQLLLAQGGLSRVHMGHYREGACRTHLNT